MMIRLAYEMTKKKERKEKKNTKYKFGYFLKNKIKKIIKINVLM